MIDTKKILKLISFDDAKAGAQMQLIFQLYLKYQNIRSSSMQIAKKYNIIILKIILIASQGVQIQLPKKYLTN